MGIRILPVNFFDQSADLIVSPAAVATMPITFLQSNVRDDVWRSTSLAPQVFSGTWGGDVRQISSWGIFPPKSGSTLIGAQIRVQLFSDVAMTSSVYDSGTIDVFTFTGIPYGTFAYGAQAYGVDNNDRTSRLSPLVSYFAAVAAVAYKVTLSNAGAMDATVFEASRFWLADYIEAPYSAKEGMQPQWVPGSKLTRTIGGTARRQVRTSWRELRFETMFETEADRSTWSDLMYLCDPGKEIVISIFPGDATPKKERDHTVLGSLSALNPLTMNVGNHTLQLAMTES